MNYSCDSKRNLRYLELLDACDHQTATLYHAIKLGQHLMTKARLHPHFFGNNTLLDTAKYLAFFALQLPYKYSHPTYLNRLLSHPEAEKIIHLFERRISERIPTEYLTQEAFYSDYSFYVNDHVLVPRSVINTRFQDFLRETHWKNYRILDLCTGSGCIGITLALLHPTIQVDLADISIEALNVAQLNIQKHSLQSRVKTIHSDLFDNIQDQYDLIITNPPYVPRREYQASPAEFRNEPTIAFDGGPDGLDLLHKILGKAKSHLNPQGSLIAEVGFSSAKRLKKHYRKVKFEWFKYRKPNGKVSWFAMDCAFRCEAKFLL